MPPRGAAFGRDVNIERSGVSSRLSGDHDFVNSIAIWDLMAFDYIKPYLHSDGVRETSESNTIGNRQSRPWFKSLFPDGPPKKRPTRLELYPNRQAQVRHSFGPGPKPVVVSPTPPNCSVLVFRGSPFLNYLIRKIISSVGARLQRDRHLMSIPNRPGACCVLWELKATIFGSTAEND